VSEGHGVRKSYYGGLGLLLLLTIVLASCMTADWKSVNSRLDSWVGSGVDKVYAVYGPPFSSQDLSDGGKTILYEFRTGSFEGTQYSCQILFLIRNQKVWNWRYNGNYGAVNQFVQWAP